MSSDYKDGYLETKGDYIWLSLDANISIPIYNHKDKRGVGSMYIVTMPDEFYKPNNTSRQVRYLIHKPTLICF